MIQAAESRPLFPVVEELCQAYYSLISDNNLPHIRRAFPSRNAIHTLVDHLRAVLFPGYFGMSDLSSESLRFHVGSMLDQAFHILSEQIMRGSCALCKDDWPKHCSTCALDAKKKAQEFIAGLPELRRLLGTDAQAAFDGDPAAHCVDEILYCYPGMLAITSQRIAHELYKLKVPLLPRMITEHAHSLTGIDIHPGARIGESFFIDHGTGVVVGETCVLGNHVKIYQGVTLGAKSFPLDDQGNPIKDIPRHPMVEDHVTIYAGATILGRITIGKGSMVGGNAWITKDVPPGSVVTR